MKNKNFISIGLRWGIVISSLIVVFYFFSNLLSPAAIINPLDYFQITPRFATFSEDNIFGNKVFYTLFSGRVTLIKSSPFLSLLTSVAKEAKVTFLIKAQNKLTGDWVILNSAYLASIKKSFPKRVGEYYQAEERVPLRFSTRAESGDYNVVIEFLQADAKIYFFGWIDIKSYLPQRTNLGLIKYTKQ